MNALSMNPLTSLWPQLIVTDLSMNPLPCSWSSFMSSFDLSEGPSYLPSKFWLRNHFPDSEHTDLWPQVIVNDLLVNPLTSLWPQLIMNDLSMNPLPFSWPSLVHSLDPSEGPKFLPSKFLVRNHLHDCSKSIYLMSPQLILNNLLINSLTFTWSHLVPLLSGLNSKIPAESLRPESNQFPWLYQPPVHSQVWMEPRSRGGQRGPIFTLPLQFCFRASLVWPTKKKYSAKKGLTTTILSPRST